MLEADEVDIDLFTPVASTSLAKIFGSDTKIEENENVSLKYISTPPQNLTHKEETKATKIIYACAVFGYEWLNNEYVSRGKLGAAIIEMVKSNQYNIILYDTNKSTLSCAVVSPQFEVVIKENLNLSYYDNKKKYWSIYGTPVEFSKFIKELKVLNIQVKDSSNNENEPTERNLVACEEYVIPSQMPKDDKESDTDSRIHKKTKESILKRMATMGHSILPIQSISLTKSGESSDSDENAQKVIRHKPQKSNLRRNLTEKVELHSDEYTDINLKRNTLLKPSVNASLGEQQLVPIKSTNIITNPIINNSNELNLFMSEQRMSNSELRINLSRLSDKMDKIVEKVQSDSESKSCTKQFQDNIVQKLLNEYEKKIKCYEDFLHLKGFDNNIITKSMETKDLQVNNTNETDLLKHKIQELQNIIEEQTRENCKLRHDLSILQEKYENSCKEFEKKCDDHIIEVNSLKQELSSKIEETKNAENNSMSDNDEIKNKLKSIMNGTFHSLCANFDNNENYTGTTVKSVVAKVVKKETMKALKDI